MTDKLKVYYCKSVECTRGGISGVLTRHKHTGGRAYIRINGVYYPDKHLIWYLMKGEWPEFDEHVDVRLIKTPRSSHANMSRFFEDS